MALSLSVYAAKPEKKEIQACQNSDVLITTVELLDGNNIVIPVQENATDCLGAYEGNDSAVVAQNLGYDDDGWLNEEGDNVPWDGPGAFIGEADLLDLDGDGDADDPGWVLVGKDDGQGFIGETSSDGNSSYTFINDLITFDNCKDQDGATSQCIGGNSVSGTWAYTPPAQNPDELTNLLGGEFFDQVAVVFKAGNAFAIYNFTIADLELPPVFAGDYNFAFTGTWDISDVLADKGLSHVTFWARDPVGATEVPEPSTLGLLLLSSLFMFRRKLTKR